MIKSGLVVKKIKIIRSAIKLFAQYGFYNTKVEEIAKNADTSVGSIYSYFTSKKKLAHHAVTYVTDILANELRRINELQCPIREKLQLFVSFYFQFLYEHNELIDYFFKVYLANREIFCEAEDCGFELVASFIEELNRFIENGKKEGAFDDISFEMAFSVIMGILGGFTFLKNEHVLEMDFFRYQETIVDRIYRALAKEAA